jgi:PilZ domain
MRPELFPVERRKEKRQSTSGRVVLAFEDPEVQVPGELKDESVSGLRVEHQYTDVRSGQFVRVLSDGDEKVARVMWNRRSGKSVESGLMLVSGRK